MIQERIKNATLLNKVISSKEAANFFTKGMVVGTSGFTKAGDSKAVLQALADKNSEENLNITLITGASLGHDTDGHLAEHKVISKRMPFQSDPVLRKYINTGEVLFIDQHLGETAELIDNKHLPEIDIAIIEVALIKPDGSLVLTTSVGNSVTFIAKAKKIILEINLTIPISIQGIHDIYFLQEHPHRSVIPITQADTRIGTECVPLDISKVIGIVLTNIPDSPAVVASPDEKTRAIAEHLVHFFEDEVKQGRLTNSLLPLQAGIGKIANAILEGFIDSEFSNLTMYSEVLQDSTFDLIDSGKITFASASSITVSAECYERLFKNFDNYKDKILLRPQCISNAAEVIRRLGVIAINTAIDCDIYGNVNSTHIYGTKIMNGIGGSGDFARNAYLSIFVTPSATKEDNISHIVPMVAHVDHTEHDVDIIVTEYGLADLRGLAPRERAIKIIENCSHPTYKSLLLDYFFRACEKGGQTPHLLDEALSWHIKLMETGSMKI
jgi:succinyl-CoA:acetate CoA-transferase